MYFSLIQPREGCERDAVHARLQGPYVEHQWLWTFFNAPSGSPRDFLFRRIDRDGAPRYYVLSKSAPGPGDSAWSVQSRGYHPQPDAGACLHFDLRANPVVTHNLDGKRMRHDVLMNEKKRLLRELNLERWEDWKTDDKPDVDVLTHQTCAAWLVARAARCGFALVEESLVVNAYQQHVGKDRTIRFSSVDFSGELIVIDPVLLGQALRGGIGHAKAFGCGLLLVRGAD